MIKKRSKRKGQNLFRMLDDMMLHRHEGAGFQSFAAIEPKNHFDMATIYQRLDDLKKKEKKRNRRKLNKL